MLPVRLLVLFLFAAQLGSAQPLSIVLKKENQVVDRFWTGSVLAFQLENNAWEKGQVMQVRPDSFYIRPFTVKFTMSGPDTTYFGIDGYSLSDIYALPKPGYLVEYFNGGWNITAVGGHVHWLWVKGGFIFRLLGLGYIGLQSVNGLIKKDFSFSSNAAGFGIAAAVAAGGFVLKKTYQSTRRVGKKYKLTIY